MSYLFISHSAVDREQVERFLDFLVLGMGIAREEIFCTSQNGALRPGAPFIQEIRKEMADCRQVLCLISPHYLRSKFCLAEMGAAWFQQDKLLPILIPPARYQDLEDTPLKGLQTLRQNDKDDLMTLYDQLCACGIAQTGRTAQFSRQLAQYMDWLRSRQQERIPPDQNGFYCAQVEQIRNTPPSFRCYKLRGLLQLPEQAAPGETHWLFYRTGVHEDLAVGDTVRFSVASSELRQFPDLKNARNLYPAELYKL